MDVVPGDHRVVGGGGPGHVDLVAEAGCRDATGCRRRLGVARGDRGLVRRAAGATDAVERDHLVEPGARRQAGLAEPRVVGGADQGARVRREPGGARAVHLVAGHDVVVARGVPGQRRHGGRRGGGQPGGRGRRLVVVDAGRAALGVVGEHPGRGQLLVVDRDLVDAAVEVPALGTLGPRVEVVAADGPPAEVRLPAGDGVRADLAAVDVQAHALGAGGADDVVPLVVAVARRALHHAGGAVVVAVQDLARVVQVQLAVVGAGDAGAVVAEADQLAATGGGGAEPQLDAVGGGLVQLVRRGRVDPAVRAVERRRPAVAARRARSSGSASTLA